MLLHGDRVIGAAFHRRVIGDNDAGPAGNPADTGDDPARRDLTLIHAMGGER